MLQRIQSLKQITGLTEIILGNDENRETYKIVYIDDSCIKLLRRGDYSKLRILHTDSILQREWYFESDKAITDIRSNTDSQLLNQFNRNKKEKP